MQVVGGWKERKVRDVCELGRGRVISADEIEKHPGVYPVYSSQSSNSGEMGAIDTYDFDGEYVTWTTDGAYAGTVFYRKGQFNCTNVCGTLRAKGPQVCMSFIAYKLSTLAKDHVSYVGNPKLMNGVMASISLSVPASKPEQTKIAEILSTVDRAIEQTEALIAKQQRIKTGLMQDLLTRGIDEHGNLRSEQTHQFKDSPLGRIPVEWRHKELGNVAYVTKLAGFEFTIYFDYKAGGEIIALRALNIKNEHLDLSDIQRISKTTSDKLPRSKIFADDILITYIGAYIGDVLRIGENDKYHLAPNIAKVVAGKSLEPSFLEVILRSSFVQKQIKNLTATTATPSLTMTQIRTLLIAVPHSKDEQNKITTQLTSIAVALDAESFKVQKLRRLKTALMQDLLTGKKRVTPLLTEPQEADA